MTRPNFDDLVEAHVAPYAARGRANKRGYLRRWAQWAQAHGIDPAAPSRTDLDQYKGHLLDAGALPKSTNSHLSVLRMWCRWLTQEGVLEVDPAKYLALLPAPAQVKLRWLTDAETATFLDYVDEHADPTMRAAVYLMAYLGARPQEVRMLKVADIDGDHLTFRARKDGSTGRFTIPNEVQRVLTPLLGAPGPLLINDTTGRRISKAIMQTRFNRLVGGARVPRITMYGLRASFITNALSAGVPLRDVQLAAGHSTPAQTAQYDQARQARASVAQLAAAERIAEARVA